MNDYIINNLYCRCSLLVPSIWNRTSLDTAPPRLYRGVWWCWQLGIHWAWGYWKLRTLGIHQPVYRFIDYIWQKKSLFCWWYGVYFQSSRNASYMWFVQPLSSLTFRFLSTCCSYFQKVGMQAAIGWSRACWKIQHDATWVDDAARNQLGPRR